MQGATRIDDSHYPVVSPYNKDPMILMERAELAAEIAVNDMFGSTLTPQQKVIAIRKVRNELAKVLF